jgi:predicted RNA binding protein YcfA (HicA-like mRNA interferase family)
MAKASRVLAALVRDGWVETRRRGSHRVLAKDDRQRAWAYHDGVDLGGPALARIAKDFGYTLDELRNCRVVIGKYSEVPWRACQGAA